MTRVEFVEFLKGFREDLNKNQSNWGNKSLDDFLEAMERYTEDVQGYYDNLKMNIDADEATWEGVSAKFPEHGRAFISKATATAIIKKGH